MTSARHIRQAGMAEDRVSQPLRVALGDAASEAEIERAHEFFIDYYGAHMLD